MTGSRPSRFVIGEAVDVEPEEFGCAVRLADGTTLKADRVVLATGNETPASLPGAESLVGHRAWIGDPWQAWEERLPPRDASVVVLGTGLTAVDAIITLRAIGWMGTIHAVSRHGWFPHAHFKGIEYPEFPPPGVDLTAVGLDELVALVKHHCAVLHERNAHPAIIVDKLRPSHTTHLGRLQSGRAPGIREEPCRQVECVPPPHFSRHPCCSSPTCSSPDSYRCAPRRIEKLGESSDQISVHLDDGEIAFGRRGDQRHRTLHQAHRHHLGAPAELAAPRPHRTQMRRTWVSASRTTTRC